MKILFVDSPIKRTTKHIVEHWSAHHELKFDSYFQPSKAEWADVIYVEWCETIMQMYADRKGFYEGYISDHKPTEDREYNWEGKILINRPIDIDVYYNHYKGVKWGNVNHLCYIAKHIFNRMDTNLHFAQQYPNLQCHHIPLGIDLNEWTYQKRTGGYNIVWINHIWAGKNLPLAIYFLKALIDKTGVDKWKLWVVGSWSETPWLDAYTRYLIAELKLTDNISIQGNVPDINQFLEDKDFLLCTSSKEAFSLITAEAMAKGIKPVIHNWEGAKDIWRTEDVWTTIDEGIEIITGKYESEIYREYVSRYDKKFELESVDKLLTS